MQKKISAKVLFVEFFFLIFTNFLFAKEIILSDHSRITELSNFRILGEFDLYKTNDFSLPADFRTLNHEGGMELTVLQIIKQGQCNGEHGIFMYVLLTAPVYVQTGEMLLPYTKFFIFLPDTLPVYDFSE